MRTTPVSSSDDNDSEYNDCFTFIMQVNLCYTHQPLNDYDAEKFCCPHTVNNIAALAIMIIAIIFIKYRISSNRSRGLMDTIELISHPQQHCVMLRH